MTLRGVVLGSQLLVLLLLLLIAGFGAMGDGVAPASMESEAVEAGAVPLVFPLAGEAQLTDSFGDPRPGQRRHQGVDILAPKMTPVVAVADGVVARLQNGIGKDCCTLTLRHDGGWTTLYLHLNNDTEGTDDGLGSGIAPGLVVGSRVRAGEVIGWVGDSGNAEETAPHLHFELVDPEGRPVDPYPILLAAQGGPFEGKGLSR